jgi:hypothetical protein
MNTNFTKTIGIIILSLSSIFATSTTFAQGQSGNDENPVFNFSFVTIPTLISGTALTVGAKYRYTDALQGVNVDVTILSATGGAVLINLDDNTLTKPEAFSPVINIPANSNGLIEFKFQFLKANGNPKQIDTLRATAIDIDGTPEVHERDVLDLGGGVATFMSATPQISITQSGTEFTGLNIGGVTFNGIDTTVKDIMFTVTKSKATGFIYKAGADNIGAVAVDRQKAIYFKGFNYPAAVLPVKFYSFSATAAEKVISLSWITEKEIDNDHYDVERSFDAKDFVSIGLVLDGFENGSKKNYAFRDNSPLLQDKTIVYYRLKQVDLNGKYAYSNVIAVRLKSTEVEMTVSPNPFSETITARFNSDVKTTAEIRITNITGQTVQAKTTVVSKGYNNIQIDKLNSLPAGTYIANLIVNGKVAGTQKIIK